ncbi:single-stranded DNA-binding protein [uncultured Actinomyces sp.]|uniref:single-stranded DNA-binding protein n=1 Tax=uncultured Actinomyces sp. TaxID=249061 RepID=UPI00262005E5|nr:single-stranded DNA-binding protein [uncultured Actinomyces sp.]
MAGETLVTVIGNLTADPELRYTATGTPVVNFTVASTPRTFDKNERRWVDGAPLFLRCSLWREAAEHSADSLQKGTRVIVYGRLVQRDFETRSGERRSVIEMQVEEVGVSTRFARVSAVRSNPGERFGEGSVGDADADPFESQPSEPPF